MKLGDVIYIRTDGNSAIGLGHLVRCMALAHMLKSKYEICFFCVDAPIQFVEEVLSNGFMHRNIKTEEEFLSGLEGKEMVVLDHYGLGSDYQKYLKDKGCKVICIDDHSEGVFYADLIINHAPGFRKESYNAQSYTKFALGPDYALLRPRFVLQARNKVINPNRHSVFICFGGADSKNLTLQVLEVVKEHSFFKKVVVVAGEVNPNVDSLMIASKNDDRVYLYRGVSERQMLSLMVECGIAIVPASGILYEALATGSRLVSGYYTENQRLFYEGLKEARAFISAETFAIPSVRNALAEVLVDHTRPPTIIDGRSNNRICHLIESL